MYSCFIVMDYDYIKTSVKISVYICILNMLSCFYNLGAWISILTVVQYCV